MTPTPLQQLLAQLAPGQGISGDTLARHAGITRAAVEQHIAALRDLGLPVATHGDSYQLPWPIQLLDAEQIRRHLGAGTAPVHVLWQTDSTQNELLKMAPTAADLTTVLAEHQAAGRGRRGRSWQCPPGMSLVLSCLKRFQQGPAALSGLSLAMGVCIVHALESMGAAPGLKLKWPNDVMAPGGKLAGILIETSGHEGGPCVARIGPGLNLRLTPELRAKVQQPTSSLVDLYDTLPDRNRIAACLIAHLRRGLVQFEREGLAPFMDDFARLDYLAGRMLAVHSAAGELRGVAKGIDQDGALRVQVGKHLTRVVSEQISVLQ